ncbi:MAG: hypothetical protein EFT35_08935 [Methanophagales archaeon ANME-1-THS]|nr:MAG: hypothetical protein EFT35_08935 [Methanophagales archaeon ANME-1-THS]
MEEESLSRWIAETKTEWDAAFKLMLNYYETELFRSFKIAYHAATWYRFKNPALIFPEEREMLFSTPNAEIPFDYYPSQIAKLGINAHNFAYLADVEEYYPYNFSLFLWEQKEYITPLQRANLRVAHFIPDALVEVTREGLRSFLKSRGKLEGLGSYEDPLVVIETLGLMGMPRRDDMLNFVKDVNEDRKAGATFNAFLETPYLFSFAGMVTPPALNEDKKYGIRRRDELARIKMLMSHYVSGELPDETLHAELQRAGYTTTIEDRTYKPEDAVDLRWVKLEYALERVKKSIAVYEHKAAHSNYYCYADMVDALMRIAEKESTAAQSYL